MSVIPIGTRRQGLGVFMTAAGLLIAVGLAATACSALQGGVDSALTEVWEPEPEVVDPGGPGVAPSDAVVLFDGTGLDEWRAKDGGDAPWRSDDEAMTTVADTGDLVTRREFGDAQLHIEWRTPTEVVGDGQDPGNSGVYLMERYEVQVLDSWNNRTYSNGQAASIYKQFIPLVNASRRPGQWQSYDIIFEAPRFDDNGELLRPATMTVLHNGVLVHHDVELLGSTTDRGEPKYEPHAERAPLMLQDHESPVSFRNIWIRELPPRHD